MAIDDNVIIDRTAEQLINAIDITDGASATGTNSTALGKQSKGIGSSSVSIGAYSTATGVSSIAIGSNSETKNGGDVAIGAVARAENLGQSFGNNSKATGNLSTAVGAFAEATGQYALATGYLAKSTALNAIQIGEGTNSTQGTFQVWSHTLLDQNGHIPTDRINSASDTFALAVGKNAQAQGSGVSVGYAAQANGENAVSIGFQAVSQANNAIQIGQGTNSTVNTTKIKDTTILDATGKIPYSALQGGEVVGLSVNSNNHLIVTYADGTTADLGAIGGGGGTSDYTQLTNKPSVNDVELSGNKTSTQLGLQSELVSGTNIKTINSESLLGSGNIKTIKPLPAVAYTYYTCGKIKADTTNIPDGTYIVEQTWSIDTENEAMVNIASGALVNIIRMFGSLYIISVGQYIEQISSVGGHDLYSYILSDDDAYIKSEVDNLLAGKQNTLTFDSTPTTGSNNPVTSAGIKTYVDTAVGDIDTALTGLISGGGAQ